MGNPNFRSFFLAIEGINSNNDESVGENWDSDCEIDLKDFDGDYVISQYGDGWSYKTYVDGEKIFIISNELESLKKKVKDKHLPID